VVRASEMNSSHFYKLSSVADLHYRHRPIRHRMEEHDSSVE